MCVASLRLRLLAALVDAAIVIGGMAGVGGVGIAGVVAYARVRGDKDEKDGDEQDERSATQCTPREFRQSPELSAALSGASAGLAVASRNWRGPGFWVVGLRRVDARTGGIVSVRSALIGVLFDQAWQAATTRLFGSRAQRQRDRVSALGPQVRAVERKYADDPGARRRAVREFYKANDVNPLAGWGWLLAGPVVSQLALAVGSRRGRTVRDRITSTSVIVDQ
jgi:hypothetical protein